MRNDKIVDFSTCTSMLAATFAISFILSGAALADPDDDAMISDGSEMIFEVSDEMEGASTTGVVKGFLGKDEINVNELFDLGILEYGGEGGELSADVLADEQSLVAPPNGIDPVPGAGEAADPEVVIGVDRRQRLYTTRYPTRAVVYITFAGYRCSGWMISKDTVMTAGHCIHSGGKSATPGFYDRNSYLVYPGRDGTWAPYGSCTASWTATVSGWINSGDHKYDYGVIKLNCDVGYTTGWFGWYWRSWSMLNEPTIIQGYPADLVGTNQWISADKNRCDQSHKLYYQADTAGGESGSPVWNDTVLNGAIGIGIHAYGKWGSGCNALYNGATRIRAAVSNNMFGWSRAAK